MSQNDRKTKNSIQHLYIPPTILILESLNETMMHIVSMPLSYSHKKLQSNEYDSHFTASDK